MIFTLRLRVIGTLILITLPLNNIALYFCSQYVWKQLYFHHPAATQ